MEYLTKCFLVTDVYHVYLSEVSLLSVNRKPYPASNVLFQELEDSFNYGLFQPPLNGRAGETKMLMLSILLIMLMLLKLLMLLMSFMQWYRS